jgi:phosphotransferase system HPr (HPr) family protein
MKQVSRQVTVQNKLGIHIKPASEVSRIAYSFDSTITLAKADERADACSIFEIMILGGSLGDSLEISAIGHDAEEALDAVSSFIGSYMDDDLQHVEADILTV